MSIEHVERCALRHKGKRPPVTFGVICDEHAADLRDLLADVRELWLAFASGDSINPDQRHEPTRSKQPFPPLPIDVNRWLITNPGRAATVRETWKRNGNPVTGYMESNGPDAPDVRQIVAAWCGYVRDEFEQAGPEGGLADQVDYLRRHLSRLAASNEAVADFAAELRECRRALAAAIGEHPGPRSIAPCPYCRRSLYTDRDEQIRKLRREGKTMDEARAQATARADRIHCPTCRITWSGVEIMRLRLIAEAETG